MQMWNNYQIRIGFSDQIWYPYSIKWGKKVITKTIFNMFNLPKYCIAGFWVFTHCFNIAEPGKGWINDRMMEHRTSYLLAHQLKNPEKAKYTNILKY